MGEVKTFPTAGLPPAPTGHPFLDRIEMRIIRTLVECAQGAGRSEISYAKGLAKARADYLELTEQDAGPAPDQYLSIMYIAIQLLSPRNQAKLRHPARTRVEAQAFLEGKRP